MDSLFSNKKYVTLAKKNNKLYLSAQPFPNIQLFNFLEKSIAKNLAKKFPSYSNNNAWINHQRYGKNKNTNFKKANHESFFKLSEYLN